MKDYLNGVGRDFCLHCKKHNTPEGHDGCIGTLIGVMNACCGHGETSSAYVQFNHKDYIKEPNKIRINGENALSYIKNNKPIDD